MEDKVVNISFNVWANDDNEAEALKKAFCDFVDWFGQRGIKVTASKLTNAVNNWQNNILVKNSVINYFK